jgi:hypothetical protein
MIALLVLLSIVFIILVVGTVVVDDEDGRSGLLLFTLIVGGIIFLMLRFAHHRDGDINVIEARECSILLDKDAAVVRYGSSFMKDYERLSAYEAIRDSLFEIHETPEISILGYDVSHRFELIFLEK